MRLSVLLIVVMISSLSLLLPTGLQAQTPDPAIDQQLKNKTLKEILSLIQSQNKNIQFIYNDIIVSGYRDITIDIKNKTIPAILNELFRQTNLLYTVQNNKIIIAEKSADKSQQKFSINGIVNDRQGRVIPSATVFLSNSQSVTTTDAEGIFSFGYLKPGVYEIVVKTLGYALTTETVTLQERSETIAIVLNENTISLDPVVIKSQLNIAERGNYLKLFTENFIGRSSNSDDCKILNPEVLKLRFNKFENILSVNCDEFLIIENFGLGYKLSYLINNFSLNIDKDTYSYQGSPYFEELTGSEDQQKEWEQNRKKAYDGSLRHFLKAAFDDTATEEGFVVYHIPPRDVLRKTDKQAIKSIRAGTLLTEENNNFKTFNLKPAPAGKQADDGKLYIIYTKERPADSFDASDFGIHFPHRIWSKRSQISSIYPLSGKISVDRNGGLTPLKSFIVYGYWSWEKVADTVPLDYRHDP